MELFPSAGSDPQGALPERPLLVLGLALSAGALLGLAAPLRTASMEPSAARGLAAAALVLVACALARRLACAKWLPSWAGPIAALALLRASLAPLPSPGPDPGGTLLGRLQPLEWSATRAWVVPEAHDPRGTALLEPNTRAAPREFAQLARAGERVALLEGEGTPWPRGPEPPRSGLPSEFAAERQVLPDELLRLEAAPEHCLSPWIGRLETQYRATLEGLCTRASELPAELPAGWAQAVLFGEQRELDPAITDLFTRTGTRHVMAVSGMHLVLLAALVLSPLAALLTRVGAGRPRARERLERCLALLRAAVLLLYIPLASAVPPVTRSALALALGLCAPLWPAPSPDRWHLGRRADGLSLWGLGLSLECLLDPLAPLSISVQLSYLAALGLMLGTAPIARLLGNGLAAAGLGPRPLLLARGVAWHCEALRMRLQAAAATALAASLAAVLATLPVAWSRFGEWSPVGIAATPLVLPLFGLLLVGLWVALLVPSAVPEAALELPTRLLLALLEVCDDLPHSPQVLPPRPEWLVWLAVALLFFAMHGRGAAARRALRGAACAWAALLVPWTAAPRGLELHALEVGHGSALVLRAPGEGTWIFDAGSRDRSRVGPLAVAPLLASWEVSRPTVVLSHLDQDHASALPWLVQRFPPRRWFGAGPEELGLQVPRDCLRLRLREGPLELPCASQSGLRAQLWRGGELPGNEGSYALELLWAGKRALLCGDAEGQGLAALLEDPAWAKPCELLLVPHHGSDTEHWSRMREVLRPQTVWVSASGEPELAREFRRLRLSWASTGTSGPLALEWRLPLPCNPARKPD